MKNKVIASALSAAMLCGLITVPGVFAESLNASDKAKKTEVSSENGIITYQDNFSVDYYVTDGHSNAVPESSYGIKSDGTNDDITYKMAENAMNIARDSASTVATAPVGSWQTSAVWTPPAAYSDKSKVQIPLRAASDGLKIKGWGGYTSAVNLSLGNTSLGKVYDVHYKAQIGSRSIRFLIDAAENSYYEIGYVNNDRTMIDSSTKTNIPVTYVPETTTMLGRPYFRKVVNGAEEALDMANVTTVTNQRTKEDGTADGEFTLCTAPDDDTTVTGHSKALYLSDYWYTDGASRKAVNGNNWTEFDANVNYETNTIRISIFSEKWGGIVFDYVDENLSRMCDGAVYPVSLTATNDGWARVSGIIVSYSERALAYGFSQIDENSSVCSRTITANNKEAICVAEDSAKGIKFYTSAVSNGFPHQPDLAGSVRYSGGILYLKDRYRQGTTLNLDYPMISIKSIEAKTGAGGGICHGMRLFVSEDERTYYEFMTGDNNKGFGTVKPAKNTPYIRKVVDGATSDIYVCPDSTAWEAVTSSDVSAWSVEVKDNALLLSVSAGAASWTYTYGDSDINNTVSDCKYPLAFATYGDGESKLYSVAIEGIRKKSLITENEDGTVEIAVYPETAEGEITAVTAYYNADGSLIDSETFSCSKTQLTEKTYTKPDGTAVVKCFVFDGAPASGKLINSVVRDTKVAVSEEIVVACVGDSLTEGHGSTDNVRYSYPGQLQRMLGAGYTVENFGKGSRKILDTGETDTGDGSSLTYTKYVGTFVGQHKFSGKPSESIYEASKACNPNIVVIMLGTNDRNNITTDAKRSEFKANYKAMINDYQALSTDPEIYVVLPPRNTDANGTANMENYMLPMLRELAKEENVKLINVYDTVPASLLYDGIHFRNSGYKEVAKVIYDAICGDFNSVSYTDNSISVNPAAGTTSDVYAASYKDGRLHRVIKLEDKTLNPEEINLIDISSLDTGNADCVKLMTFDTENGMEPDLKLSVKKCRNITENAGEYTVSGKAENVYDSNVIVVLDTAGEIAYINSSLTDYDANYSYTFSADNVSAVYVDGAEVR